MYYLNGLEYTDYGYWIMTWIITIALFVYFVLGIILSLGRFILTLFTYLGSKLYLYYDIKLII